MSTARKTSQARKGLGGLYLLWTPADRAGSGGQPESKKEMHHGVHLFWCARRDLNYHFVLLGINWYLQKSLFAMVSAQRFIICQHLVLSKTKSLREKTREKGKQ